MRYNKSKIFKIELYEHLSLIIFQNVHWDTDDEKRPLGLSSKNSHTW